MLLEQPEKSLKPLRESTHIPIDAPTAAGRKEQRDQAEEVYRARMTELARAKWDLPTKTKAILFSDYATWYDTHHISKRRGAERERDAVRRLTAFIAPRTLDGVTRALVNEYTTARTKDGVEPSTVNREVDVLKAMLREAVPRHLKASPLVGLKRLRVVKKKKRVLSPDEELRLLAELQPADQALYIVAVDTLMRLGNVLGLKWANVQGGAVELEDSKTGPYAIPLSARAQAALQTLPRTSEYVFAHRRKAKKPHLWRNGIRLMLKRACARAGLPYGRGKAGITFHTATRASGATRMLRAGVDPRTVQGVGNWRDFRSMQEYLQTDYSMMRSAVNLIAPVDMAAVQADAATRAAARRSAQARKAGLASGKKRRAANVIGAGETVRKPERLREPARDRRTKRPA